MADHTPDDATAAETMSSHLDATRNSADVPSQNATVSRQDSLQNLQGSTIAGVRDDGEGDAAASAAKATMDDIGISGEDAEDKEDEEGEEEDDDAGQWERVAASDVKNIIIQVLSPYFDDDASGGTAVVAGVDLAPPLTVSGSLATKSGAAAPGTQNSASPAAVPTLEDNQDAEDTAQRYDHFKAEEWIALVCDGIMERLVALGKPFKFVVHAMVMRKCGAGVHVCSSCYYAPTDGWLSHTHDLSAHLYAVVTVYWCAV
ncbi:hypothetical protein GH5_07089 [Leishmania sp. Ghana 2012 LV757]|uniref:hypothetical protein n=1 Tax=Leishmania sp. Ghana 2012 LV757 TaxID=2803181 RepID=UPI001B4981C2|nr:hypothetical protein GH5_07089 [Leishmania sp. Ghana 2012 LV757]